MKSLYSLFLGLLLLGAAGIVTGCQNNDVACKCTAPPLPYFSVALLTKPAAWQLEHISIAGETTAGTAIKDRFSLSFLADGTYTQTMLEDNTSTKGTWALTDDHYSTLHLTDHKGAPHEYTLLRADDQILSYHFLNKDNKSEIYDFTPKN